MIIPDTNVWLALFVEEDSLREQATFVLEEHKEQDIFIIPEVWQELITVLSVRHTSKIAIEASEKIQTMGISWHLHNITDKEVYQGFFKPNSPHRMSFTDCLLGYLAQEEGAKILTFDKELQKYLPKND